MTLPHLSCRPNGQDVTTLMRLERAITRLGTPQGYDGDPLAERIPVGRTLGDLHLAHDLLQSLPADLRNRDRQLAHRMCQAAVFGRSRTEDRSLPPQAIAKSSANAKLARERNRCRSRRASA